MENKERLVGLGRLLTRENEFLCEVSYDLQLRQEILIAETLSGRSEIEGLRSGIGTIELTDESSALWNTAEAILELDSGEEVNVLFPNGLSPLRRAHAFITSGEIRKPAV